MAPNRLQFGLNSLSIIVLAWSFTGQERRHLIRIDAGGGGENVKKKVAQILILPRRYSPETKGGIEATPLGFIDKQKGKASFIYRRRAGSLSLVGCGLLRSGYADSGVYLGSIPPIRGSGAVVAG